MQQLRFCLNRSNEVTAVIVRGNNHFLANQNKSNRNETMNANNPDPPEVQLPAAKPADRTKVVGHLIQKFTDGFQQGVNKE